MLEVWISLSKKRADPSRSDLSFLLVFFEWIRFMYGLYGQIERRSKYLSWVLSFSEWLNGFVGLEPSVLKPYSQSPYLGTETHKKEPSSFFLMISRTVWATVLYCSSLFESLFWRAFGRKSNISNRSAKSADFSQYPYFPVKKSAFSMRNFTKNPLN